MSKLSNEEKVLKLYEKKADKYWSIYYKKTKLLIKIKKEYNKAKMNYDFHSQKLYDYEQQIKRRN